MSYTTSWNEIVSQFKKNIDAKEEIVQNTWEMLFKFCFGFSDAEIDSQRSVKMGVMTKRADIVIKNAHEDLFVVELKRHLLHEGQEQLFSYLNQMKIDLGILVCDNLYIYDYDYTAKENAFSVLEIPFEPDNIKGITFVELFSEDNFDKQTIKDFIKESNEEIKAGNEIKKELTPALIKRLLKNYFSDKYPMPDIEKFLDEYNITINPKSVPVVTRNSNPSFASLDTLFTPNFNTGNYGTKDSTQYMVNGTPIGGKGPTVFAAVDYYVKSNPGITFGELQQAFPDYLAKPGFGKMIRRVEDVGPSEWSGNRFKKQPILLEDGQRIVVTNQWKPDNMQSFIRGAQKLGIDIQPLS